MWCDYGLIYGTKRCKDNQSEKNWIASTKQNTQSYVDNRLPKAMVR